MNEKKINETLCENFKKCLLQLYPHGLQKQKIKDYKKFMMDKK